MAMVKKGSRRIEVDGVTYRWRVSRWRMVSDWKPSDLDTVDARWLEQARKFGLGDSADVVFNIPIELFEAPRAHLLVKYHAKIIDGFLGFEQLSQIKPGFVRQIIQRARAAGWDPRGEENKTVEILENSKAPHRAALLLLPGWSGTQPIPGYDNVPGVVRLFPDGEEGPAGSS